MVTAEVGNRLKARREQKGWDQEELAYRSRLSVKTVSNIECGKHWPRLSTLVQLAETLEVEVSEMLPWLQPAAA